MPTSSKISKNQSGRFQAERKIASRITEYYSINDIISKLKTLDHASFVLIRVVFPDCPEVFSKTPKCSKTWNGSRKFRNQFGGESEFPTGDENKMNDDYSKYFFDEVPEANNKERADH
ncbi:hypothetical protein L5515_016335 [Caenorhabditis briggsae]|uniref:Uncharacterized protein n=1 Tax=Caenorhabditis briggsae TaxID=6238 RepID=A0AAE9F6B6_CAEBR|nr:hypothetical protein L5515_016335 [Caenorhabditis briggsae]